MLTFENMHVPISVPVGDTLELEPTHICEKDLVELTRTLVEELDSAYLTPLITSGREPAMRTKAYECKTAKSWFPYE